MTTPDTLARLATLSLQRTARTEALHGAVKALLSALEDVVKVGDEAHVDGHVLRRRERRSNVGLYQDWAWTSPDGRTCDPDRPVDGDGHTHRDFHHAWCGPSRAELIALARRANGIVLAFVALLEDEVTALETAEVTAQAALALTEQVSR